MQAFGKTAKGLKAKAPIQPAGGKGSSKAKDGSMGQAVDAAVQREEEAGILAAVQSVTSGAASDAAAAEERLKVDQLSLLAIMQFLSCGLVLLHALSLHRASPLWHTFHSIKRCAWHRNQGRLACY